MRLAVARPRDLDAARAQGAYSHGIAVWEWAHDQHPERTYRLPSRVHSCADRPDLAQAALAGGAQVYVTGEVKHSTARWAEASGLCIIDAGHYATENPVVESLVEVLLGVFADKDISIPVQASAKQQNPFVYHQPEM